MWSDSVVIPIPKWKHTRVETLVCLVYWLLMCLHVQSLSVALLTAVLLFFTVSSNVIMQMFVTVSSNVTMQVFVNPSDLKQCCV